MQPHSFQPGTALPPSVLDWNELAKKLTQAIRSVDQRTPILVGALAWDQPHGFVTLEPTGDSRTVYEVHTYQPQRYTKQKAAATPKRAYPGPCVPTAGERPPWPCVPTRDGSPVYWSKEKIKQSLVWVRRFQQKYHAPIFMGEFGCVRWAPGMVEFARDELAVFESYGWSWAYWDFPHSDGWDIDRYADPEDHERHADAPRLQVFKSYYARNADFLTPKR